MSIKKETRQLVRKAFTEYLEKHGQRKTAERFSILDEIYSMEGHFDIDHLYEHMLSKGHKVSRATLYNTIELLQDANLVTRHQFGKNLARFEKSFAYKQHDHLICEDCEHVFEFCDPRIQQIQSMMGDLLKFDISHHSLHLFGKCRELAETGSCKHQIQSQKQKNS
ncbi:MAG: transcriptional repressor [Bacteroidetes bacterium]|nr:MAG: transcriptional repressor [Bacteroidota bacterium]REK07004.1 MAG: transcriptional repressor [Bacteroidota bacterium]REK33649.1 MAG: transcriptional repressor [Bacteroidota bacterium]REK48635.1 MAG: transcriptional repressor [Bacteroidota bacterium]